MTTICISANTIYYPTGGGHRWVYLNWALGLRAIGCDVIWLEGVEVKPGVSCAEAVFYVRALKCSLEHYGLAAQLALWSLTGEPLPTEVTDGCLTLDEATKADLLLNFLYHMDPRVVGRFRRSALVDIDPGLLQVWMTSGVIRVAPHDVYFTTGETVGQSTARIPNAGMKWNYTPPCVATDWWQPTRTPSTAPFTTITHWNANEWVVHDSQSYSNDKRDGFHPYLELPHRVKYPLELALSIGGDESERSRLMQSGWRISESNTVSSTPWDYQKYIQNSRGEFSCAKPSCVRMQNAWISDRTLCYLSSGKPAVVQYTGRSRILPSSDGLFRFQNVEEAVHCLERVAADYDYHCRRARALAEEYFNAQSVTAAVVERAL